MINNNDNTRSEPVFNLPPVVQALCLINTSVFLLQTFFPRLMTDSLLDQLAFVPTRYMGVEPLTLPEIASPLTHMFIHASWLHLLMNMAMLMAFGAGLEKTMGGKKMLLFYFATGLCGAAIHTVFYPHSTLPMIGASGAISGLFGGVVLLMYDAGMMGAKPAGQGLMSYRTLLPVVLVWIGVSVFFGFFGMPGLDNPIAWDVHVGGFISGLLLYRPVCRLKIKSSG